MKVYLTKRQVSALLSACGFCLAGEWDKSNWGNVKLEDLEQAQIRLTQTYLKLTKGEDKP